MPFGCGLTELVSQNAEGSARSSSEERASTYIANDHVAPLTAQELVDSAVESYYSQLPYMFDEWQVLERKVAPSFKPARSYEEPYSNYFAVIIAFKEHQKENLIERIRKWFKGHGNERIVITREKYSKHGGAIYTHYNILVTTKKCITDFHDKNIVHIGKMHCPTTVPNYDTARVLRYMFKENKTRPFYLNEDYIYYSK